MSLVTIQNVSLSHGGPNLLENVSFAIEAADRICVVGRNGAGKSTLLRIIAGTERPDIGTVGIDRATIVSLLPQETSSFESSSALTLAAAQAGETYHSSEEVRRYATEYLTKLGIDTDQSFETMSGGERRRTLLAGTLAGDPDVLLLDEPTNHLDIETVGWLENLLVAPQFNGRSVVFVTHDRAFARRVATRILEIDRGTVYTYSEDYDTYIQRRNERIATETNERALFDKQLAEEEAWLRRGTPARRTRNEGRVKALERMREEYRTRRGRIGSAAFTIAEGARSGDLVVEAEEVSIKWGESVSPLLTGVTTTIFRGDKIGIIGPNGSGKTTLIRALLPQGVAVRSHSVEGPIAEGAIRWGANIQPIYFDQLRGQIDPEMALFDALGDGYQTITVGTQRTAVTAYMKRFLFSEDDARRPVGTLSGGERNRLLLARLFAKRSNVIVLDEPTNDLDIDTLELLEERLSEYTGTVILVSHDRDFLDQLVAACLVINPDGSVAESIGGYSDWARRTGTTPGDDGATKRDAAKIGAKQTRRVRKLTFNEKRELAALPERIATLEEEKSTVEGHLSDPELYRTDGSAAAPLTQRLSELETEIHAAYERWETLDEISDE